MRHFAITGIVTASWISRIFSGSAIRATPPWTRMSAGTRSSAITATAPASSAILACSAVTTSMITPPLSISARPVLTRSVPISSIARILPGALEAAQERVALFCTRRRVPDHHDVLRPDEDVVDRNRTAGEPPVGGLDPLRLAGVLAEGDVDEVVGRQPNAHRSAERGRGDEVQALGAHPGAALLEAGLARPELVPLGLCALARAPATRGHGGGRERPRHT